MRRVGAISDYLLCNYPILQPFVSSTHFLYFNSVRKKLYVHYPHAHYTHQAPNMHFISTLAVALIGSSVQALPVTGPAVR